MPAVPSFAAKATEPSGEVPPEDIILGDMIFVIPNCQRREALPDERSVAWLGSMRCWKLLGFILRAAAS